MAFIDRFELLVILEEVPKDLEEAITDFQRFRNEVFQMQTRFPRFLKDFQPKQSKIMTMHKEILGNQSDIREPLKHLLWVLSGNLSAITAIGVTTTHSVAATV